MHLINQLGNISSAAASTIKDFTYDLIVTSNASTKVTLLATTILSMGLLCITDKIRSPLVSTATMISSGIVAQLSMDATIAIIHLEILKCLSHETNSVKLVADLSAGFSNALSNGIYDLIKNGCFYMVTSSALAVGVATADKWGWKKTVPLIGIGLLGPVVAYAYLLKIQAIGAMINAAQTWHPPRVLYTNSTLL